jgi:hypothetical protein
MDTSVKGANSSQTVYMVPFVYIWSPSGGLVPFEEDQKSRRGPRGPRQKGALFVGIFSFEAYPDELDGLPERVCVSLSRDTLANFEKQHRPLAWQLRETP